MVSKLGGLVLLRLIIGWAKILSITVTFSLVQRSTNNVQRSVHNSNILSVPFSFQLRKFSVPFSVQISKEKCLFLVDFAIFPSLSIFVDSNKC